MSDNNNNKDRDNYYMAYGVGFGLLLGNVLGVIFDNIAIWAGVGMLLGIVIGAVMDSNEPPAT